MKKNIVRLFVFLFPIFLIWASLEVFYRVVPNNYTVKYESVNKQKNKIEVLLFGTSHCFYGLNPKYFSSYTFNLSNITQTLYFDALLFEEYFDQMPNLKQVVFCIEYSNLSKKDNTDEDLFRKYYYENYMHLDVPIVSVFDPKKYSLAFSRSLEKTMEVLERYDNVGSIVDCRENGWGFTYPKVHRFKPEFNAKERAKAHIDGSLDFSVNQARLQRMIAACKKRNIEVVIVSLPQTELYTTYLNPVKVQKIFRTCADFAIKNDNVRYLNLFTDKRFVDEDFFDADHLNDVGAVKCSKIVDAFLNEKTQTR